jgi:Ca2+-binding RTX toxin-like protein
MAIVHGHDWSETINIWDGVTNNADTIYGYGGHDDIYGWGGADTIFGGDGNDDIFGENGDDLLKGGGGADDLYGGSGTDTADYSDSSVGVQVYLTTGLGYSGTAEGDTLDSLENVQRILGRRVRLALS